MSIAQRIYAQAFTDGMPPVLANLMVWQSAHETAYGGIPFNSHVFLTCNNGFGYKWVNQSWALGPCLSSPEGDYYAKYSNIEGSTHEMCLWIKRRQTAGIFPADLGDIDGVYIYAQLLKDAGFYGDTVENYYNGLLAWSQSLGVQNPGSGASTASIPVLGWLVLIGTAVAYRKQLFPSIFK
jgi:hypothetical protein